MGCRDGEGRGGDRGSWEESAGLRRGRGARKQCEAAGRDRFPSGREPTERSGEGPASSCGRLEARPQPSGQ